MTVERRAGPGAPAGSTYWLISDKPDPTGAFVLEFTALGRSLPVFSFKEEAELFLALGGLGEGWRAVESGAGDFVSLLLETCAGVESVVLDPLPTMVYDSTAGLVSLSPGRFLERFLGQGGSGDEAEPG